MKVISLLQPWASLVVGGFKRIETRSWNTKFRGELLIHASAAKNKIGRDIAAKANEFGIKKPAFDNLPFGAIIGKVELVHTVQSEYCFQGNRFEWKDRNNRQFNYEITDQEFCFGDFSKNRYGWMLHDPIEFATPIPAKGSLSLWNYEMPDHFHIPIAGGGHATFSSPPDIETLNAVKALAVIAQGKLFKQ